MKSFQGYVIVDSEGIPEQNSIKAGRSHCIREWLSYAPYGGWNVAKAFGYRCKKVVITLNQI